MSAVTYRILLQFCYRPNENGRTSDQNVLLVLKTNLIEKAVSFDFKNANV